MLKELVLKNRSYRRFYQAEPISETQLIDWVDLARNSASARNAQPLKYFISAKVEFNARIFEHLAWAGYYAEWPGPEEGERPSAYIIVLRDTLIPGNFMCDDGIASQSILLGATEEGFGGCIIHNVDRKNLGKLLDLPVNLEIVQVLALGKPKETVVLEAMKNGEIKYWRDENQVHHVPKRSLDEIIINYPNQE
jgi:nitroreductase